MSLNKNATEQLPPLHYAIWFRWTPPHQLTRAVTIDRWGFIANTHSSKTREQWFCTDEQRKSLVVLVCVLFNARGWCDLFNSLGSAFFSLEGFAVYPQREDVYTPMILLYIQILTDWLLWPNVLVHNIPTCCSVGRACNCMRGWM